MARQSIPYSCNWAARSIAGTRDKLLLHGLIRSWIEDDDLQPTAQGPLVRCASCRKTPGQTAVKKCGGWKFSFGQGTALKFETALVKPGHLARVVIEGQIDTRRVSSRTERLNRFAERPMAAMSLALSVMDHNGHGPLARHHIDLANHGQAGPVWHLQMGGKPHGGARHDLEWLDVPRWPCMPLDHILLIDLVLYNFFLEKWLLLRRDSSWCGLVRGSEDHMLDHYKARLDAYWSQRARTGSSWLASQCNVNSGWVVRPG